MEITATYDFETHKVELYGRDGTDIISGTLYMEGDPGMMIDPFLKLNSDEATALLQSLWDIGFRPEGFADDFIPKAALAPPSGSVIQVMNDTIGEREYLQTQLDDVMKQNSKLMDILLAVLRDE